MGDQSYWSVGQNPPFNDLSDVLTHFWAKEIVEYRERPEAGHVFEKLVRVANWLNTSPGWTASDYVAMWALEPELSWQVAWVKSRPAPEGGSAESAEDAQAPEPAWSVIEPGPAYEFSSRDKTLRVHVGYDRRFRTYFGVVRDVGKNPLGNVVLGFGMSDEEVPTFKELEGRFFPYVVIPPELKARLIMDQVFATLAEATSRPQAVRNVGGL